MNFYAIEREQDAHAVAKALDAVYPAYRHTAVKYKGRRLWSISVHCAATNALLITRAAM